MIDLSPGEWAARRTDEADFAHGESMLVIESDVRFNEYHPRTVIAFVVTDNDHDAYCLAAAKQMRAALIRARDKVVLARSLDEPGSSLSELLLDARDILGAGIYAAEPPA